MDIFILAVCVFIALVVTKDGFDMCKTRAEVDILWRLCKFLAVAYVRDHREHSELFDEILHTDEFGKREDE